MHIANLLTADVLRAARQRLLARQTERALRQLDAQQLTDIGVDPSNLRAVAWDLAGRQVSADTAANDRGLEAERGTREHAA